MSKTYNIALAGNPNVGKSTIFNALTGSNQHVGNWPGKTVEKKEGKAAYNGLEFNVVDLPGTYSLTAYSMEEIVARDYLIEESPDVVIHVIDASNIERNLYMTTELLEIGANVVLALNMIDIARSRGIDVDEKKISSLLGIPVVKLEANRGVGIDALLDEVVKASGKGKDLAPLRYGNELDGHIDRIESSIKNNVKLPEKYRPRWAAVKLLEDDAAIVATFEQMNGGKDVLEAAATDRKHLEEIFGEEVDAILADGRYGLIAGLTREAVKRDAVEKVFTSDRIDKLVTHRILGIPIFLFMMYLTFQITFVVATPLSDMIDSFFADTLATFASDTLTSTGVPQYAISFVADAVIGGLGSVFVFVPQIFLLFLIIAILEDSGYMARAAFVMDKLMSKLGLHGKSFLPMILGFGCGVPAIMASRTLENEKDRILTVLITPFMSCGARLPVYVLFAAAFFPTNGDLVVFSLYIIGIAVAIAMGLLFRHTMFKGALSPFLMELPPYRIPTLRGVIIHMWERGWLFIKKMGTVILAIVIIIWVLSSVPFGVEYASQDSAIGLIGTAMSPVFAPLGFGNWQSSVSLVFGFLAKEVVVGTMGTIMGVADVDSDAGQSGLINGLQALFTPLSAYAFLIFVLLYVPCVAALAAIKREIGLKWAAFAAVYTTIVAWVAAFIVYQGGMLLGFG
jgi:ferrous iron transport protein B